MCGGLQVAANMEYHDDRLISLADTNYYIVIISLISVTSIMMSDSDSESESKGESQTESMPVPMSSESVYKRSSTGRKRVVTKERADKGVQGVRKERADKGLEGVRVVTKERADKGVQGVFRFIYLRLLHFSLSLPYLFISLLLCCLWSLACAAGRA